MDTALLIEDLNRAYGWDLAIAGPSERRLPGGLSPENKPGDAGPSENALEALLAEKVNGMIQHDFGALVQLLYRIDVREEKLRRMLEDNTGEDAGRIIARLIMERQWQKIETRRQYRRDDVSGADQGEERW